jgi:hypothetical protein
MMWMHDPTATIISWNGPKDNSNISPMTRIIGSRETNNYFFGKRRHVLETIPSQARHSTFKLDQPHFQLCSFV